MTKTTTEIIHKIIPIEENIDVILAQETHASDDQQLVRTGIPPGFVIAAGAVCSRHHGITTYVAFDINWQLR